MHAIAEIVLPPGFDVEEAVKTAMGHFLPRDDEDEPIPNSHADWWDFYVIGGRFSGAKTEARIDESKLEEFINLLKQKQVTVSSVTCGKQELQPASQRELVDTLWRERFPGCGDKCFLFKHARDQYRKTGYESDDVCTVAELPDNYRVARILVLGPHWEDPKRLQVERMWATEYWNKVEFQSTNWTGDVKEAITRMRAEQNRFGAIGDDWLCVTIDYHN